MRRYVYMGIDGQDSARANKGLLERLPSWPCRSKVISGLAFGSMLCPWQKKKVSSQGKYGGHEKSAGCFERKGFYHSSLASSNQ